MNWGDQRVSDVFWDLVHPEPNSGCWLWTGVLHVAGYGRYRKSPAENVRRGTAWTWRLARTHGSCGHPLDLIYNGYRRCSICNTASKRKYKEKMKKLRSK